MSDNMPEIPQRPQRGLGRGLSSLLGENEPDQQDGTGDAGVSPTNEVPVELIRNNPNQPRRTFPVEEIDELAQSIRERGIIQPILVRPMPDAPGEYQIVAGERRWRAAQKAGLNMVPVTIRELADDVAYEIAVLENVQRKDLNPVEEAHGYYTLMQDYSRTQDEIAQVVGKSRSHVANMVRLLALPSGIQNHLVNGNLSMGHARALANADNPEEIAKQVIEKDLSVRDTEKLAKGEPLVPEANLDALDTTEQPVDHITPQPTPMPPAPKTPGGTPKDVNTLQLEHNLSTTLGLSVDIQPGANGMGKMAITYQTLEQLDEVCRRLMQTNL